MNTPTETTPNQFIQNREGLARLIAWLADDAPTVTFDMHAGIKLENESGIGKCGTSCCIAGAAAQMALGVFGETSRKKLRRILDGFFDGDPAWGGVSYWYKVPETAVKFLGIDLKTLPYETIADTSYVLDLFSDSLAPVDVTPSECIKALENFDRFGTAKWSEIKDGRYA